MEDEVAKIAYVDSVRNSVIVEFQDGRVAKYSAALLYSLIGQAEELHDADDESEDLLFFTTRNSG